MRLRTLVLREVFERKNQLATSFLAILLGITAIVAIKNVTFYSEKAVAKELDALGANILVLPKSSTLQDYYSSDVQGEEFPEEYVTTLATSGLKGLDNLSPKFSIPVEMAGRRFTLTGILPKSEFQAKAAWQGAGVFRPAGELRHGYRADSSGAGPGDARPSPGHRDSRGCGGPRRSGCGCCPENHGRQHDHPQGQALQCDGHPAGNGDGGRFPRLRPPAHGAGAGRQRWRAERHRDRRLLPGDLRWAGPEDQFAAAGRQGGHRHADRRYPDQDQPDDVEPVAGLPGDHRAGGRGEHRQLHVCERLRTEAGDRHPNGPGGGLFRGIAAVPAEGPAARVGRRDWRLHPRNGWRRSSLGPGSRECPCCRSHGWLAWPSASPS